MKKKKLLYLDEKNYKELQMMCLILGRSVSSYIDELIANELKKINK